MVNIVRQIVGVLSNKVEAYALRRAEDANIATAVFPIKTFPIGKVLM